jgi:hypothetical protein
MGWSRAGRHLVRLEVIGRPAVFATAAEADWKVAVRQAVAESGITPPSGRFQVRMIFRTPTPKNANEKWDIDNLVAERSIWAPARAATPSGWPSRDGR